MGTFLIQLVGYLLIYLAVDVNRKEDSEINFFDKNWFIVIFLVITGAVLIQFK
jgi:hypothetical protein